MATLATGLFAGAALYINLVEHPARMSCGTVLAVTQFAPSYKRGAVMQVSLALLAFLSAIAAWWMDAGRGWLIGGLLIVAVIPFTLLVILPTNKKLLDPALDKDSNEAQRLLVRWGRLHAVRTGLSLGALVVFLLAP
ncbi:MAG: DUF1772 domain-containing protein [Terriglobales bacterium]